MTDSTAGMTRAENVVNVGDSSRCAVERDVQSGPVTAKSERDEISLTAMFFEKGLQGEIGQNIAIVDKKRGRPEQIADIGDATRCLQQDGGFLSERDGTIAVAAFWKRLSVSVREVMGVDHKLTDAGVNQMVEGIADQRSMEDRD